MLQATAHRAHRYAPCISRGAKSALKSVSAQIKWLMICQPFELILFSLGIGYMEVSVSTDHTPPARPGGLDPSTMTVEDVARYAAQVLWERQARDIKILYVEELVGYTDYLIVASARNERHVEALGNTLERRLREVDLRYISREGARNQRWGVIDYGDFVVHLFEVEERALYDLDGLWHEAEEVDFQPETNGTKR